MRKGTLLVVFLVVVCPFLRAASGPVNGRVAFVSDRDGNSEIYVMNVNGLAQTRLTSNAAADTQPAWSPDRTKIAFTSDRDGNNEIYVMDANGANQTRLTHNAGSDSQPTWSPDGRKIVFQSTRAGGFDIFIMRAADGANVVQLTSDLGFDTDPAFSPKGTKIAFTSSRDGNHEIYSMNPDGSGQTRLTNNTLFDSRPDFSPDGRKIVYQSNVPTSAGLMQQVVIMSSSGANPVTLTSTGANGNPAFGADGRRIFFNSDRDGNVEVYAMNLDGSNQVRLTNNSASDNTPVSERAFEIESTGVYRPTTGQWLLRNTNTAGPADLKFTFGGEPGDLPVTGNWNGDERTDIGFFRDGVFHLAVVVRTFFGVDVIDPLPLLDFGDPGDLPLAGDWDGDGIDDVGVFRPSAAKFILRQPSLTTGIVKTISFNFGAAGDLPVAGDWDGDGIETVGTYRREKVGLYQLTNDFNSSVEIAFELGIAIHQPMAGDWLGNGSDRLGIFEGEFGMALSHRFETNAVDVIFAFGQPGDVPVAGNWSP